MQPDKFLWWGSEIRDFEEMCRDRDWVSRDSIQDFILDLLPAEPVKVRVEVPTDYWSDIENPRIDSDGEIDLLDLDGIAHYPDKKIDFHLVARMERDRSSPGIEWKVWKMQKKHL